MLVHLGAAWLRRAAEVEYADELIVAALSTFLGVKITIVPYTRPGQQPWVVSSYEDSDSYEMALGNNDVHYVWLAKNMWVVLKTEWLHVCRQDWKRMLYIVFAMPEGESCSDSWQGSARADTAATWWCISACIKLGKISAVYQLVLCSMILDAMSDGITVCS